MPHEPVAISGIHVNASRLSTSAQGRIEVSIEVDGRWVVILSERFDPSGFHLSHIIEDHGIRARAEAAA